MARVISAMFSPFYAATWAFVWLLWFSRLQVMSLPYKVYLISVVAAFTILIPLACIHLFRRLNNWSLWQLSHRRRRHAPYVFTLMSYAACLTLMVQNNTWAFFRGIILTAIAAQAVCALVNVWWKISTHMVGMGGLVGMVIAFAHTFYFNPVYPICLLLLLSGVLGTARMMLRQHSLSQIYGGFAIGLACALLFLVFNWKPYIIG